MHDGRELQGNLAEECELVRLLFGGDHDKFKEQFEKNVRGSVLHGFLNENAKQAFFPHFFYSIVALPYIKLAEENEIEITAYRVGIDKVSFKFRKDGKDLVKTIEITYNDNICPNIEVSDSVDSEEGWSSLISKKDDALAEEVLENDDAFAEEVPENNEEHSFEALLEQISKKQNVDRNVRAMFNKLSESFNINKNIPSHDQEAAQQGFVFGFLMLHYKHKHGIDCEIEHSAGKGRSDLIFTLDNGTGDVVPILVELKAGNNYHCKGIDQIKERGYLCNLDVIMKTKSRYAIIVGVNLIYREAEAKVEAVEIIRPKNIISEILKICASQDDCDIKGNSIKGLLEPLYYSILNTSIGGDCFMSRLFAGQLLLGNEEHDEQKIEKFFFVHSEGNTTFILKKPREEGSVIINFVEAVGRETRSGSSNKNISLPLFLENHVKFPVNKIDVVVDQAMIKFQDRFVVKFSLAHYARKDSFQGIINSVKEVDMSNLITGYLSQFMRELVDASDSIQELIGNEKKTGNENYFKAVMLGLFTNDKFAALPEYNGYGNGPIDLLVCFKKEFIHALALELKFSQNLENSGAKKQLERYLSGQKVPGLCFNWYDEKSELTYASIKSFPIKGKYTFLHLVAYYGEKELAEYLIKNGADVNAKDSVGDTPFHYAALANSLEVVKYFDEKYLKDKGDWMDCKNNDGATPLHYAASANSLEVVKYFDEKYLKDKDGWMDCKNNDGATPLHYAASANSLEVVKYFDEKYLKDKDGWMGCKNNDGATPFHLAASDNSLEVVKYFDEKYLKDKDGWMGCKNNDGATPFHYAASDNSLEVVKYFDEKYLKDKDGWMGCKNNDGATPFHLAASDNSLEVVKYFDEKYLKDKDGWMGCKNNYSATPFHYAARGGHLNIAQFLSGKQAVIDAKDNDKRTPLHLAAKNGHEEVVKFLLEKNADHNVTNIHGDTPLDLAKKELNKDQENSNLKKVIDLLSEQIKSPSTLVSRKVSCQAKQTAALKLF